MTRFIYVLCLLVTYCHVAMTPPQKEKQKTTYFLLFPQVDFHTVHRNHDVDFFLLDVFHLEFILQRDNKPTHLY